MSSGPRAARRRLRRQVLVDDLTGLTSRTLQELIGTKRAAYHLYTGEPIR